MTQWLSLNAAERHLSGDTLRKKSSSDSRHVFSSLGSARAVFLRERDLTWHRYRHAADVSCQCWLNVIETANMFSDYRLLAHQNAFSFVYLSTIIIYAISLICTIFMSCWYTRRMWRKRFHSAMCVRSTERSSRCTRSWWRKASSCVTQRRRCLTTRASTATWARHCVRPALSPCPPSVTSGGSSPNSLFYHSVSV